jgi:hypothetical protein
MMAGYILSGLMCAGLLLSLGWRGIAGALAAFTICHLAYRAKHGYWWQ